jgi:hypothetical protein
MDVKLSPTPMGRLIQRHLLVLKLLKRSCTQIESAIHRRQGTGHLIIHVASHVTCAPNERK